VTHLAFAPAGAELAVATPSSVLVGKKTVLESGKVDALGWLRGRLAVAVPGNVFLPALNGAPERSYAAHGSVETVTPKLVILRNGPRIFAGHTTLLTVPRNASVRDLQVG
jgi:hypothetical protein